MQTFTARARLRRLNHLCLAVAATVALVACGGGDDDDTTPAPTPAPAPAPTPAPAPAGSAPVAVDDAATMAAGQAVTIYVLHNDIEAGSGLDYYTVRFVDPPSGASLTNDSHTLTMPGQGTWASSGRGVVIFTPEPGFTGTPTDVTYTVADFKSNVSNPANIRISVSTGPAVADALVGRWVPLACGDLSSGGSNGSYRIYHIYVKTSANTLERKTNRFNYSASPCAGSRQMVLAESDLLSDLTYADRLELSEPENLNGYKVYRVQYHWADPWGRMHKSTQRTYTFTPSGNLCMEFGTENLTTAQIVEAANAGNPTQCGTWERLD